MGSGREKNLPQQNEDRLTPDDEELLNQFCDGVSFDEVSFEQWSNCHSGLDLQIPVKLTRDEAEIGCEKQISWSRQIRSEEKKPAKKIRVTEVITFPPGTYSGFTLKLENKGDEDLKGIGILEIRVIID